MGRLNGFPHTKMCSFFFIERLGTESFTINMMFLIVIEFQFSLLKGISVEKQLDVKKRDTGMLRY